MKNQVKIVQEVPQLTDLETARFRDFDGLMRQHSDYRRVLRRNRIIGSSGFILLVILGLFFYTKTGVETSPNPDVKPASEAALEAASGATFEADRPSPATKLSGNPNTPPEIPAELPVTENRPPENTGSIDVEKVDQSPAPDQRTQPEPPELVPEKEVPKSDDRPVRNEFTDAAPVLGMQHLYEWMNEHIVYPEELRVRPDSASDADGRAMEGVVVVQFTVGADSSISRVKVVQSLGESFDKEAIRLIKSMPPWKPATRNGQPLNRSFTLPVRFSLKESDQP